MKPSAYKTVIQHAFTIKPEHVVWLDEKAAQLAEQGIKSNMSSVLRDLIDAAIRQESESNNVPTVQL